MYFSLFVGVLCLSCYALLCVHSSFAFILKRTRKLVALLLLFYRCIVTINGLWLFITVSWVVLQCVILVFPDHTHLLFERMDIEIIPLSNFCNNVQDFESTLCGFHLQQPPYPPS